MKNFFNGIKAGLISFRIALISFSLKVKWLWLDDYQIPDYLKYQSLYWVKPLSSVETFPSPIEPAETIVDTIIKIAPRLLIAITFIVWIVSFIKIRKIDDNALKKKKIKNTIIIISLLIILIIGILLLPLFLNK